MKRIRSLLPKWCHLSCKEMRLESYDTGKVTIESEYASLTLTRAPGQDKNWKAEWRLKFSSAGEGVSGMIFMSEEVFKAAFGIDWGRCPDSGRKITQRFGGDSASESQFIRVGRYLNIPGPGTGLDGDANISLWLSDEIIEGVTKALSE